MEKIYINMLENGVVSIAQDLINEMYNISNPKAKKELFDTLSQEQIEKLHYIEKNDTLVLKSGKDELHIKKYKKFSAQEYFKSMSKKVQKYNRRKLQEKIRLIKCSIATGIVSFGLGIGVLAANSINRDSYQDTNNEVLLLDEEIIDDFSDIEEVDEIEQNIEIEISYDNNAQVLESQIPDIQEYHNTISVEEEQQVREIRYFDKSKFETYDDIIRFASSMYNVDYNLAKKAVEANMDYILGPKNEVSVWMTADKELDRMKDLKDRGIIEPDIVSTGIFITIKNYAYDHNTIESGVVISEKTVEQKEQDIIDVARNIYGVTDERLLASILAAHRLETDNGTSNLAINQNNQGGNRNEDLTFIVYRTAEIGAESMVRHFLNNYSRALCSDTYNPNETIAYGIAKTYCETPKEWAEVVHTNTNYILENNGLEKYLDNETYKKI